MGEGPVVSPTNDALVGGGGGIDPGGDGVGAVADGKRIDGSGEELGGGAAEGESAAEFSAGGVGGATVGGEDRTADAIVAELAVLLKGQ
ncbi:MAG: hypothetical protein O3A92_14900 [Verrucomicrobia bacterium]|nr:hypothetical protein [Verrucomicrobiota bacterium]